MGAWANDILGPVASLPFPFSVVMRHKKTKSIENPTAFSYISSVCAPLLSHTISALTEIQLKFVSRMIVCDFLCYIQVLIVQAFRPDRLQSAMSLFASKALGKIIFLKTLQKHVP